MKNHNNTDAIFEKLNLNQGSKIKLEQIVSFSSHPVFDALQAIAINLKSDEYGSKVYLGRGEEMFIKHKLTKEQSDNNEIDLLKKESEYKNTLTLGLTNYQTEELAIEGLSSKNITLTYTKKTIYFSKPPKVSTYKSHFAFNKKNKLTSIKCQRFTDKKLISEKTYNTAEIEKLLNTKNNKTSQELTF